MSGDFSLFGQDLFGEPIQQKAKGVLQEKYLQPPFTVLNAREGAWQDRKRAWTSIGIQSELGREDVKAYDVTADYMAGRGGDGTSIFDPTLCEIFYTWFCPPGGQIVDPFAGGSVRGVVAGSLGFKYWGSDLSGRQLEANREQAQAIEPAQMPVWVHGDSMDTLAFAPDADLVFSCPPYGDLEVYSDDPRDLSAMEDFDAMIAAYQRIILRAVKKMKPDSFACFVVGDYRDKKGYYRNFVSKTIEGFENAGARLYNEAILVTAVGSAAPRAARPFNASRKLAKVHQNILVFCNGDPKAATKKINGDG